MYITVHPAVQEEDGVLQLQQHEKKVQEVGHHMMLKSQVLEVVSGGILGDHEGALKSYKES